MTEPPRQALGTVFLVGGGPGDPGLITVRGRECLGRADLVLYDYLVNPLLLEHAPAAAQRVPLGHPHIGRDTPQAEINRRMIEAARAGRTVVRLKSGDPYLFGRGAEEVEALRAAGVPLEVVPGVTSAMAGAAYVGIPVTHRDWASAVAFVTGHQRADKSWPEADFRAMGAFPGTLVIYMGIKTAPLWSRALMAGGKPADTPVLIVRRATWPDQETLCCTLATAAEVIQARDVKPPALVYVGQAVLAVPPTFWFGPEEA